MKNVNEILSNYTIYIDSTSLMEGSMEFFKISLQNVLSSQRKLRIVDFVVKELRKKQFSDNEKYAVKALNVLDYYRKRSLVDDIVTSGIEQGKLLNVIYNNRNLDQDNICVITESREVATEIIQNLKNEKYVKFEKDVVAIHLNNGPAIWKIEPLKHAPRKKIERETISPVESVKGVEIDTPKTDFKVPTFEKRETTYEEIEVVKPTLRPKSINDKLVVSLVVDNSSSIQGERATKLKEAINIFMDKLNSSSIKEDLDLAVYGFDGFNYGIIKEFDKDIDLSKFDLGGVQVLGKTLKQSLNDLLERNTLYKQQNIETHRPWLIVLTDGDSYGDVGEVANELKRKLRTKELTYFPFSISNYEIEDNLTPLQKIKMFLHVKPDMFDDLLLFIYETLETRIKTPKESAMTLNREALQRIIKR